MSGAYEGLAPVLHSKRPSPHRRRHSGPIWAIIAAVAVVGAAVFLLVALFVWLADIYDALIAGVVIGCAFLVIA